METIELWFINVKEKNELRFRDAGHWRRKGMFFSNPAMLFECLPLSNKKSYCFSSSLLNSYDKMQAKHQLWSLNMKSLMNEVSIGTIVHLALLPILLLPFVSSIYGNDFWMDKSYQKWSEKECNEMLQNSPWAKEYAQVSAMPILQRPDKTLSDDKPPYLKYQIQLRSALPIRQAIIRMAQITQKYDDLKPEQKQQFDKQAEAFLAQDVSKWVVVYIIYETNQPDVYLDATHELKSSTTETLKNSVYLYGSKGERVPLEKFVAPQGAQRSFQLIFPRQYQGKEILGPQDKSLNLEFPSHIEFKTEKMNINGKVEY
jgi:hypothetical protein